MKPCSCHSCLDFFWKIYSTFLVVLMLIMLEKRNTWEHTHSVTDTTIDSRPRDRLGMSLSLSLSLIFLEISLGILATVLRTNRFMNYYHWHLYWPNQPSIRFTTTRMGWFLFPLVSLVISLAWLLPKTKKQKTLYILCGPQKKKFFLIKEILRYALKMVGWEWIIYILQF